MFAPKMQSGLIGPIFVGIASFIWATDALVRYPAIGSIDPTSIVSIEHFLAVLILLPWVLVHFKNQIFSLSLKEWLAAAFCGAGGSALASVVFTASFFYVNPSVAVLLQKLQPILVVVIAYIFLGERPAKKFYFWGTIALAAGVVLSFPDLNFRFLFNKMDLHSKGIQYAFLAAMLWAASTVSGKVLVKRTPVAVAIFWRFFFGAMTLAVLLLLSHKAVPWNSLTVYSSYMPILYLSLIPGLFAMLIYYAGLSRTSASVTAFIELLYPIGAVALNTVFLHTPLEPVQTCAGAILLIAVAAISF